MEVTAVERPASVVDLVREIARYLAVVDALREEGLEPRWRPELSTSVGEGGEEK
jgi:hypothetical protein